MEESLPRHKSVRWQFWRPRETWGRHWRPASASENLAAKKPHTGSSCKYFQAWTGADLPRCCATTSLSSRIVRRCVGLRSDQLLVNRKLFLAVLLATRSRVSSCQVVMSVRIFGLQLYGGLKRCDGVGVTLFRHQANSQAEIGLTEVRVKLRRTGKVRDSVVKLLVLAGQLPQHIFRTGIGRIELQFLLEFLLSFFRNLGAGIRLRKQQTTQPKMNAGKPGILLQNCAIFLFSVIPLALHFVRLGEEFVSLRRGSSGPSQVLRCDR